jgi:hypothetical protein
VQPKIYKKAGGATQVVASGGKIVFEDGGVGVVQDGGAINVLSGGAIRVADGGVIGTSAATPVNAVAATGTLTISGVVIDGETVTIGDDAYEFAADAAQTVGAGHIPVDITAVSVAAQGTLTMGTQPTAGDTMTIGDKTYTFVPAGTANTDGEIALGVNAVGTQPNVVAAINGADDHNTPHPLVSAAAFAAGACVITALAGGTAGNLIVTTETFTPAGDIFDATTLGTTRAGVDTTAAQAVTALVAAITASDTQGVGAADGAGDTVALTADVKGAASPFICSLLARSMLSVGYMIYTIY